MAEALGIPTPEWEGARYCHPDKAADECDGNGAWVATQMWFYLPWNGRCFFGLRFERNEAGDPLAPYVTLVCGEQKASTFRLLKSAFREHEFYHVNETHKECGFTRILENPLNMDAEFDLMMNHFIAVWRKIGGLDKLFSRVNG